ncbi:rhodanese-like domain-containing protein [uncultured Sphingorhabdus sp.]|uniref:rhodanese-like domain-containing protein n=1 Tax=uncultured Sphingorhabdus sp. TaxID=1686106 RepID=UPI00261C6ED3|nr:rhodanese-like domain-containing protein [uncultured Sphingorhabdus sp.]HMS20394.1 rhodanese-like domain-containing protein [Sphingorhabdus sp.]
MRILALALFLLTTPLAAQDAGSPLIDYAGFRALTSEVQPVRSERLVSLAQFKARAARPDVLVLDTRSAQAFKEGHIAGAINLPLPDFTAESLAEIIGTNPDREILIYCNNNFTNNRRPVVTKALPLALNIQTFINLYGYGYKNVWELGEAVDMDDPRVGWTSTK